VQQFPVAVNEAVRRDSCIMVQASGSEDLSARCAPLRAPTQTGPALRNSAPGTTRRRSSTPFLARWTRSPLKSLLPDSPQLVPAPRKTTQGAVTNKSGTCERCRGLTNRTAFWRRPQGHNLAIETLDGAEIKITACDGKRRATRQPRVSWNGRSLVQGGKSPPRERQDRPRGAGNVCCRSHLAMAAEEAVRNRAPSPFSLAAASSGRAATYVRAPQKPTHEKHTASR
jgi:hypothetical protein